MPQPSTLLVQVLDLLQTFVDDADSVSFEFRSWHLPQRLLEVDQELVNPLLQEVTVLLTLDQHPVCQFDPICHWTTRNNVTKLFLGSQNVKNRLLHSL